ncbi:MAG: hypothetical protein KC503_28585 [Myxococcales bacterium]|nr:hypothetical protein [Myxococcales bacterium]
MRRTVAMAACAGALLIAAPVLACGNTVELELDGPTKRVNGAEMLVRAGKPAQAYRAAWRASREVRNEIVSKGGPGVDNYNEALALKRRARRVMAIAQLRASGRLGATGRLAKRTSKRRQRVNLRWSRIVLQRQWIKARKDPVVRARYAEALAASPSKRHRAKALSMLQTLASKDLMPDAWAYRTLAQLHHARSDSKARDAAVAKCRLKAGANAASICPTFDAPVAQRPPVG